jgi:alkylhydroperoxidase/carboxymuconolactone decarboxylase family protein
MGVNLPPLEPTVTYYEDGDLAKFPAIGTEAPHLADAFFAWYGKVFDDGELTKREKALIALAVAHAVKCPYCIDAYTAGTLEQGCTRGEQMEAVHVAAAITGGAVLVHGVQMRKRADQLSM